MPTKSKFFKRLLIWRYKHISEKNFVFLLSLIIGLLAGLISVFIKNITFAIEAIFEKGIIHSENSIYAISRLTLLGHWLFRQPTELSRTTKKFLFEWTRKKCNPASCWRRSTRPLCRVAKARNIPYRKEKPKQSKYVLDTFWIDVGILCTSL